MTEEYISSREYETYYGRLNNLRFRIAANLPIRPNVLILDVATGEALFAIEAAKCDSSIKITGIDISESSIRNARKNLRREGLQDRIEVLKMDATNMDFRAREFDMAINFTGLEDIHMTRGKLGVKQTFLEVNRVLKPDSYFCFVVMPPEELETEAQRIEAALFSYICDATWLSVREYEEMVEHAKFRLVKKRSYVTGKKLTPEQAKAEIRFACKWVPRIYGIKTPSFEAIWARFGKDIDAHGLGHYSKVVLMIAKKVGEVK